MMDVCCVLMSIEHKIQRISLKWVDLIHFKIVYVPCLEFYCLKPKG